MQRIITLFSFLAVFGLLVSSTVSGAGSNAAEEAAIRKIIATGQVSSLSDLIQWSGATLRPVVGREQPQFTTGAGSVPNRVPGSNKASDEPIRIVVADSRDLAYEYGKGTVEYDLQGGQHAKFETGYLRIWQKQDGDWKQAAVFRRSLDSQTVRQTQ